MDTHTITTPTRLAVIFLACFVIVGAATFWYKSYLKDQERAAFLKQLEIAENTRVAQFKERQREVANELNPFADEVINPIEEEDVNPLSNVRTNPFE